MTLQGGPMLDRLAAAYDIPYYHIRTGADIRKTLVKFLADDVPALLQVDIDPADLAKY